MYSLKTQVRYSECDKDGRLSLPGLVNLLQDCAVAHSISVGRGPEVWMREQMGWIITSWQIIIDVYPALNDEIGVSTYAYAFHGAEGDRNFTIEGKKGRRYAYANSTWVYFDRGANRPVRIPKEESDAYRLDAEIPMEKMPRHIKLPAEGFSEKRKNKIRSTHIDTNHHVNNEAYLELAMAHVKSTHPIRELQMQYIRQARLGDILVPLVRRTEAETYVSFLLEGKLCAIARFIHPKEQ